MPTSTSSSTDSSGDSSGRLHASRCPECGAPVDWRHIPPEQSQVKCRYCGTLIRVPGRTPRVARPKPEVTPARVINTASPAGSGAGCSWISTLVTLIIFAVVVTVSFSGVIYPPIGPLVGQMIGESFPSSTGDNGEPGAGTRASTSVNPLPAVSKALAPKPHLVSRPYPLANNDQLGVQMLVTAYRENGSFLIGFDPTTQREGWRSLPLSERFYEFGITSDAQRAYVADGAQLLALDRKHGAVVWQTSLANKLQSTCPENAPCLQVVDSQVVALTRDGTVQAFLGASGAPLWSRRLNSTPRRLMSAQGKVLAVDTNADNDATILVLNSATGDLEFEITPTCNAGRFGTNAYVSDQFFVTPDANSLIVMGSGSYACAWRFDLTDGALSWRYESLGVDPVLPTAWAFGSLVFGDPIAYFIDETDNPAQIWAMDTRAGDRPEAPLYSMAQYKLEFVQTTEALLLVSAAPKYALDEVELWAIDRASGTRRWQRRLETTHSFDKWMAHVTHNGIFVAVCQWKEDVCRFLLLDPETGVSRAEVRHVLGRSVSGGVWMADRAYLTIQGALHVINLNSVEIEYVWP